MEWYTNHVMLGRDGYMNKGEKLFAAGFLWVALATALAVIFNEMFFMGIGLVMFLHFFIAAYFLNKRDRQESDENIADVMEKERVQRELAKGERLDD